MKPYSFIRENADTGCCPGHDWPRCYRWAGKYSSSASKKTSSKLNKIAKRIRRRKDKNSLRNES